MSRKVNNLRKRLCIEQQQTAKQKRRADIAEMQAEARTVQLRADYQRLRDLLDRENAVVSIQKSREHGRPGETYAITAYIDYSWLRYEIMAATRGRFDDGQRVIRQLTHDIEGGLRDLLHKIMTPDTPQRTRP